MPFEDRSACLRRFEAGEVQICADVPAEQMTYMKEKLPDNLRIAPYLGAYYLPVKVAKEKFADPRVRQAISMLIDRDFIADEVWQGTMLPAYALVPPGIDNYVEDPPELDYADDGPARPRGQGARALRGGRGRSGDAGDPAQLQLVGEPPQHHGGGGGQAVQRRHQVDAERDGGDELLQLPARGRRLRHRARRLDRRLFRSAELPLPQRDRACRSTTPAGRTPTTTRRCAPPPRPPTSPRGPNLLAEAEKIYLAEVPSIPILFYSSRALVSDKVAGYEDNILDDHFTRWLSLSAVEAAAADPSAGPPPSDRRGNDADLHAADGWRAPSRRSSSSSR